jgi:hypothetical protein
MICEHCYENNSTSTDSIDFVRISNMIFNANCGRSCSTRPIRRVVFGQRPHKGRRLTRRSLRRTASSPCPLQEAKKARHAEVVTWRNRSMRHLPVLLFRRSPNHRMSKRVVYYREAIRQSGVQYSPKSFMTRDTFHVSPGLGGSCTIRSGRHTEVGAPPDVPLKGFHHHDWLPGTFFGNGLFTGMFR